MSAYFAKSSGVVGVYLRLTKNFGDKAFQLFQEIREEIDNDLGIEVNWETKRESFHSISHSIPIPDAHDDRYHEQIKEYFLDTINRFINTFRHRLERIVDELS